MSEVYIPPDDLRPVEEKGSRSLMSRRASMRLAILVAAIGLGGGGLFFLQKSARTQEETRKRMEKETKLKHAKESLDKEKEALQKECLEKGHVDGQKLVALFVQYECLVFLEKSPDEPFQEPKEFLTKHFQPFTEGVKEALSSGNNENDPAQKLIALKLAFDQQFVGKSMQYEKESSSIVHVLTKGLRQCRSGTKLLVLLSLHLGLFNTSDVTLVEIYTPGHTFPGILFKDGHLFALESTVVGEGKMDLGDKSERSKRPLRVVDAPSAMLEWLLGKGKVNPVLEDSAPEGEKKSSAETSVKFSVDDGHGFGERAVPPGSRPLKQMNYVGNENTTFGETPTTDSFRELLDQATPDEQKVLKAYMRGFGLYFRIKDDQVLELAEQITTNPNMPDKLFQDIQEKIRAHIKEVKRFIQENDILALAKKAHAIARKYKFDLTGPVEIHDNMCGNLRVYKDKRKSALRRSR